MKLRKQAFEDIYPSRHAAEPEMLERRDPVVFGDWRPGSPLSREQVERFDREGYLVLENVLDPAELSALDVEMRRLLGDPGTLEAETVVSEPGSREIRSIFAIHRQSRLIGRLAADERLAGLAAFLLGDDVYVHQSRLNYKPGFKGKEFYWHSDFETWHAEDGMPRMRALSMSVLLAENTPLNGPLMVMPGSHRTYVTCVGQTPPDHYRMSLRKQEYGVPDELSLATLAHRHGIEAPTGKPGTIILFDCNMMHGSNGNITPFPRANAFLVFNAVSNRLQAPFAADRPRPPFVAERDFAPIAPQAGPLDRLAA
ncbi:ectoine hydroxylase [Sphingosinicella terrae]|uniref:ectoine hydroxylase n=1 Tax=Sphingosinicella terrae TaxID=2172047 RepID=UPI000E0D3CF6|nr:ectoine hydroxylase [Sphingosinicella terrae]